MSPCALSSLAPSLLAHLVDDVMLDYHQTVKGSRPKTSLGRREVTATAPHFIIALPESETPYRSAYSSFESDFQTIFDDDAPANDDRWTHVTTTVPARGQYEPASQGHSSEGLPSLDALPRPERLFESQLPYHLIVKVLHNGIVVQSSHQPSLELLASYLIKYTKSMKNVSTKVCKAALHTPRCSKSHSRIASSCSKSGEEPFR